jgi:hypothetical protein
MLVIALLILFILSAIAFGILAIVAQHLFLIGFFVAIVLLLGDIGYIGSRGAWRGSAGPGGRPPEHA